MIQSSPLSLTLWLGTIYQFSFLICKMDDNNRICLLGFLCRENETRHAKYLQQIAGHLRGGCCVGNNVKQNLLFFVSRYLLGSGEGAMEDAQSPCPWHAHMLCGETGIQVPEYRTAWWAWWWGGEQYGLMEAENRDFALGDLGMASQLISPPLWNLLNSRHKGRLRLCSLYFHCVHTLMGEHVRHCVYYFMLCLLPAQGKVCLHCRWALRVGFWWTLW